MAAADGEQEKELLSSVVADIRSYSGSDPLRPWLRGVRKMERALPPATLREKLPRFLQKCAQEFQDDMDYVADAKPLLKKMERNGIGLKRASFYMAYALYYEKHKRFGDAEKMYNLGIQNLAEPIGELHKAHEQFILRMESYKRRKDKEPVEPETTLKRRSNREKTNSNQQTSAFDIFVDEDEPNHNNPKMVHSNSMKQEHPKFGQQTRGFEIFIDEDSPNGNDQNAGHYKNSKKENMKSNQETSGFQIFVDENEANCNVQNAMCHKNNRCPPRPLHDSSRHKGQNDFQKPFVGGFAILPDDEEEQCEKSDDGVKANSRTVQPTHDNNTLLCPVQADSGTRYHERPHPASSGLQEDTVIHRFVGSTTDDEAKVENACHHGLVDPTVNLKEAMDDINNMFGRPLNFKGERTMKKANTLSDRKAAPVSGFSILADDDLKENTCKASQSNSCKFGDENGLFEPTITTRDVMAEINDMFGMPLDF
ncbi:putative inactive serine/threonine-protein kinase bub1 [Panicum miliaceum]|uniref:Inactive serine/threonine-protein kinase bub1 n=1 Tax=Panicum miliaceum TaxID=4540 RepID=A0A3L6PLR3_PANMI|nr:putative inactive serine/threonine-protein kinase bub1 [Panicum miliaceum]